MSYRFIALLMLACSLLPCATRAADMPPQRLSAEDAQRDLRILRRALTSLHAGLYRYRTPAQIEAEFEAANAAVAQGATRGQMYLLGSRIAAAVRCGHTWTNPLNQSPTLRAEVFEGADKLPLTLRVVERRFLVTASLVPGLAAGAELLAIDGRDAASLVSEFLPYLRADGDHPGADGKRIAQLDHDGNGGAMDRLLPLLHPPLNGLYVLRVRDRAAAAPREISVMAVSEDRRSRTLAAAGIVPPSEAWSLRIEGDTAVLTIPTFAFWRGGFDAPAYLAKTFAELAARQLPYLIIDQRRNEGGDNTGRVLLRHLLRQPYTVPGHERESAYERAPYALMRFMDTWDYDFFDRTGDATRGPGRNFSLAPAAPVALAPVDRPYAGRSIVLTGPVNSSAGFLFARDAQHSGAALTLGQHTAGTLRGLNGGQLAWVTLPASGVSVDIPLVASIGRGDPPDAGITPDVLVAHRFDEAAAGIDPDWRAAQAQIERWRSGRP